MADERGISDEVALKIIKGVAKRLSVSHIDLWGASRAEPVVSHRAAAMHVLRVFGMSYPAIARVMHKRDHTTVISACKRIEQQFKERVGYKAEVDALVDAARGIVETTEQAAKLPSPKAAAAASLVPGREPPLLTLLKTGRDELSKSAQAMHRLSMLFDQAILRLEGREETPITVNATRADEELP